MKNLMHFSVSFLSRFIRIYYLTKRSLSNSKPEKQKIINLRSSFYKRIWELAATSTGANLTRVFDDYFLISKNNKSLLCKKNETNLDGFLSVKRSLNKPLTYSILKKHNFNIPEFFVANKNDLLKAISIYRYFNRMSKSVTVKPANNTGSGEGITVDLANTTLFILAFAFAGTFSEDIIIEETIKGNNYRLLYFRDKIIDAVQRKPPTVTGDGKSKIRELINRENLKRIKNISKAQSLIAIDLELKNCLKKQGYTLNSVLEDNKTIKIKNVINDNTGTDNISVMNTISQEIIDKCSYISKLFSLNLIGIDIITEDINSKNSFHVIEVNANPGFFYHYHKKDKSMAVAVADIILNKYFNSSY